MLVPTKCPFCDGENTYKILVDPPAKGKYPQAQTAINNFGLTPRGDDRHALARCRGCGHAIWAINPPVGV